VSQENIEPTSGSSRCSRWIRLTQSQIDAFAGATGDLQSIHCANAESEGSPFGGPIAHGLLLVSLGISLAGFSGMESMESTHMAAKLLKRHSQLA